MKEKFGAPQIARRKPSSLAKSLHSQQVRHPDEIASKLIGLAQSEHAPGPSRINAKDRTLAACVDLYETYKNAALDMRNEAAALLASTPYAFLTSLPGMRFVPAAGVAGELRTPDKLKRLDSLCAYSGIVPGTHQSGGLTHPQRPRIPSNDAIISSKTRSPRGSQKLRQYGPPEWKDRFARWKANGQHGLFAGGRRYLRLMQTLIISQIPYETPEARMRDATHELHGADLPLPKKE